MLASVAGQAAVNKADSINLLSLVNNKSIEDQENMQKQTLELQKKFICMFFYIYCIVLFVI